ncbi:MAG: hypothetical protein ACYSO2_00250 [Planctomycetota bacterium]|jgi:DNA-directed RNA polymerase specialized sigma24 family protein/protocatechuate 3,4-dioxygenase beta subunit
MEKFWDNKKIRLLLAADTDTAEQFVQQFGPVIYTWIYYQVGADAKIATDLTGQAFAQGVKNLSNFDPTQETLFQWLKQQAAQSCEEGLGHLEIKPQRPWAWSQLPDEVLCGLSRFRLDPLDDKILDNPSVHEIAQAALAGLEATDRQLLAHRYCHLDTVENIAEEMNSGIEDIQNQLYRSRHSFRRGFFQLITSANSGFTESSDTGDIEVQEANLEKLLSTTTVYQPLDSNQINALRKQLLEAAEETAQSLPIETPQPRFIMAGVIIFIIACLISGTYWMLQNDGGDAPQSLVSKTDPPRLSASEKPSQSKIKQTTQNDMDEEELKRVFALGQAGNVEALLEVLKSGQFASQAAAAHFIGKLADPAAIELLQQAEEHWYPESSDDNAFADAVEQILIRFPEAASAVSLEEVEPEVIIKAVEEMEPNQPALTTPNITGLVSDFSNQPIANAVVELTENPLFSNNSAGKNIGTAETDSLGQFQFSDIFDGAISLKCQIPAEGTKIITRSLWCKKDSICVLNIGGRPALTGTVIIDGRPLAGQTLYLSDTLDMIDASFKEEVVTDLQGNFSFLGVSPGIYSITNRGVDNRIHRLATIEMPQRDIFNVNLDIETVTVWLDDVDEPEKVNRSNAVLVYAQDISENMNQIRAVVAEDNSMLFENVIGGAYVLRVQMDSGMWLQQDVEIEGGTVEQTVQLDPVSEETATLRGNFLNAAPIDLFLTTASQNIHLDIAPNADGTYELAAVPSDIYSLAAFVRGQLIEFTQIDLQNEPEMTLDIDPAEMMRTLSPLTVVVTDTSGIVLSDAQVWLTGTGGENLLTASSTGRGAFLAAPAGQYTLSVAHPKYPTINREIILKTSSLLAEPNIENTVLVQLGI